MVWLWTIFYGRFAFLSIYNLSWSLIYSSVGFFLWVNISSFFRLSSIFGSSTFSLYYSYIRTCKGFAFLYYFRNYLNFSLDFFLSSSNLFKFYNFFCIYCRCYSFFYFYKLFRNYYSSAAFSAFFIYWYRFISYIFSLNLLKSSLIYFILAYPRSDLIFPCGSISYISLTSSCTYNRSVSSSLILLNLLLMIYSITSDIF